MAVVQISKIQVRRGKKNQGTGMPQLASGELAWAIDTQELFIGSGAISEGAPTVRNTKVLTDKDSLLELVGQYRYQYDSQLQYSPVSGAISRTLQNRLDDGKVSARNFGILPSTELPIGQLDQTSKIQQAINSIAATTKVTLEFDPGEYEFSQTITLPANIDIAGFGKDVTVFKFNSTGIAFDTVEFSKNQKLSNFTIKLINNNSSCIRVNRSQNQSYNNLKLESNSKLLGSNNAGIRFIGNATIIPNNTLRGLDFKTLSYASYLDNAASFNLFENCLFEDLYQGVVINSGSFNTITECTFDNIQQQAFVVTAGTSNTSKGNIYKNVASTLSGTSSTHSIIKFVTAGNLSVGDIFERQQYLESNDIVYASNPYVSDLEGIGLLNVTNPRKIFLPTSPTSKLAIRLPLNTATGIKIDYLFHSVQHNQTRKGTINLSINRTTQTVQLSDEYEYDGSALGENALIFTADFETETEGVTSAVNIRINYINNNANDQNTFTYTYSILS